MLRSIPSLRIGLWLVLMLVLGGCGQSSIVGRQFNDFTAYYNTFYNARNSFDKGVRALEKQDQPVDRTSYLSIFPSPGQSTSSKDFEDAITKSADVLRSHPGSKWVDDALLLIGKAYFYQRNYIGAEQKFTEVIALDAALADEARFWLARALIAGGSLDQAARHLSESLESEDLSPRWAPQLRLVLGELLVKQQAFEDAAEQFETGLKDVRDSDLGARSQFLLGQVYETLGRHKEAAAAYERVQRFNPRYELSYAAQISAVRVEGTEVDEEAGLRKLRRMERDDKHYANRSELAYIRGRIYQAAGYADDALDTYDDILYHSDANISSVRGRIHYALGELFRDSYADFLLAAAYFDTASTALRAATPARTGPAGATSSAEVLTTPEAITDAQELKETFGSYASVYSEVSRMDSLLHLGSLDADEFGKAIHRIREQRAREIAEQERLARRQESLQRFQSVGTGSQEQRSGQSGAAMGGSAGFYFHKDAMRVQESRLTFFRIWGERPLVPNWRRMDAIQNADTSPEKGDVVAGRSRATEVVSDIGLPVVDYSDVPRDSLSRERMRAQRAAARYELANVVFLSMNRPDTAASWYRLVIEEDADQPVAQRAFYALAELQRSMGDEVTARRLYEQVLEAYPDSDFADRVREQLGLEARAVTDTLALAEAAYGRAYYRWIGGYHSDALNSMVRIAADYRETPVAPRALLAAGTIYMEMAERDSLDLLSPLPLRVVDSLLVRGRLLAAARVAPAPADSAAMNALLPTDSSRTNAGLVPPPGVNAAVDDASVDGVAADASDAAGDVTDSVAGDVADVGDGEADAGDIDAVADTDAAAAGRPPVQAPSDAEVTDDSLTTRAIQETPSPAADSAVADLIRPGNLLTPADDGPLLTTVDSVAVRSDASPAADTAAAAQEGALQAPPAVEEPRVVYLSKLYASITEHYARSPYAERAKQMIEALDDIGKARKAVADSLAAAVALAIADSVTAAGPAADSLGTGSAADSLAAGLLADSLAGGLAADALAAGLAGDSVVTGQADDSVATGQARDSLATGQAGDSVSDGSAQVGTHVAALAPSDSVAATGAAQLDSLGSARPAITAPADPDATAEPAPDERPARPIDADAALRRPVRDGPPADEPAAAHERPVDPLFGKGGIDTSSGGWTIIIGSSSERSSVEMLVRGFGFQNFRSELIIDEFGGVTRYRAALGQFKTAAEAREALETNKSRIPTEAEVHPIPTPDL